MIVFLILAVIFLALWLVEHQKHKSDLENSNSYKTEAEAKLAKLEKYSNIVDAEEEANRILSNAKIEAETIKVSANDEAKMVKESAKEEAKAIKEKASSVLAKADARLSGAENEAAAVIAAAREKASLIAGEALEAKENAEQYSEIATAMRNTIKGYGDEWLKPTYSILDELSEELGYAEAGQKFKEAKAHSVRMVKEHLAALCDYVEENRRVTAINFVVDAFNGKVDSILSKTKKDNYGKLERQIKDAYNLVNYNGKAFRNARISEEYLDARLQELHWAVIMQEIRAKEIEEQRELREKMREEEKARRDFERAQKAAEKEEAMLQKAMEKAQAMLEKASLEQREKYEAQLAELETQLQEAKEKAQRALSMAQQTKHGNVYVISNVGSFGENIYKVGMTRRLDPLDRVRELGDASVPFKFDVHAIIESEDAPALEHQLHQDLALMQMNKVNPKKEFFRVSLAEIRQLVEKHGYGDKTIWTMTAEAAEYKETLRIEEQMKNDPAIQKKWLEYTESLSSTDSSEQEEAYV